MKKLVKAICFVLMVSLILAMPAYAESAANTRGSAFFAAYGTDLNKTSASTFEIWFDVDSNAAKMSEIGVSSIEVYRSIDQQTWVWVKTYEPDDYPQMIDTNTYSHLGYVTYYNAMSSAYYRALVTFYAKNATGVGERDVYTEIIRMG